MNFLPDSNGGKLFNVNNKLFKRNGYKTNKYKYFVPSVYKPSLGFNDNIYGCWMTTSELHAINHYRKYKLSKYKLKNYIDRKILKQDYLFSLSSKITSNLPIPNDVKDSFIPREHQKVAIEFGELTNGKFIISDQQRTGKSFSSLLYVLSQEWATCLICCPSKVVQIWRNMIPNICDININIIDSKNNIQKGGFNICSYDILHRIHQKNYDICIADECHYVLNSGARRSDALMKINSEKRIALSATPILNNEFEIINLLKWVDPEFSKEINNYLNEITHLSSYERTKLLGIELRRNLLLLRETSQVGTTVEPYINFIEIDSFVSDKKDLQEVGRAKVNWAVEYLNSFQNKILVIIYFEETGNSLRMRLGNKCRLINGKSTKQEINEAKALFEQGEIQYLIGSSVIAEGWDLSHCSQMLILEESSHSMKIDQLRERCNNIFKQEEVTIDIAIIPGTQDDRLYDILNNKFDIQNGLRDS